MPDEFWDLSIAEILDIMNAEERNREDKFKRQIALVFTNAEAVATRIAYIFGDVKKRKKEDIVQPWDIFPELFAADKQRQQDKEDGANLIQQRMRMDAFAARWNKSRKEKNDAEQQHDI